MMKMMRKLLRNKRPWEQKNNNRHNGNNNLWCFKDGGAVLAVVVVAIALMGTLAAFGTYYSGKSIVVGTTRTSLSSPALFDYTPTRHYIDGVEAFSKFPSTSSSSPSSTATTMKGIVLLFHGCTHDGIDWFTLPEERIVIRYLVERLSMGVVAFSSHDRTGSKCWSKTMPASDNVDARNVAKLLPQIVAGQSSLQSGSTTTIPYYGIGASSGGTFVTLVHQVIPLRGMEVIVSAGHPRALERSIAAEESSAAATAPFPKIAYVSMSGDARAVQGTVQRLFVGDKYKNEVKTWTCTPKPVTAEWLSGRIDSLSLQGAVSLVRSLAERGILEASTGGNLLKDPRRVWDTIEEAAVQRVVIGGVSGRKKGTSKEEEEKVLMIESLREAFNVAYAQHENTSEYIEQVFDFFLAAARKRR